VEKLDLNVFCAIIHLLVGGAIYMPRLLLMIMINSPQTLCQSAKQDVE